MTEQTLTDRIANHPIGHDAPDQIATESGARAALKDKDTLQVFSSTGVLVFEYDAGSRTTRVVVPDGDLEFLVPEGALRLRAEKGVSMETPGPVAITGQDIRLATADASSVHVHPQAVELTSPTVRVCAERAEARAKLMRVQGDHLSAGWKEARIATDRLDTWSANWRMRADDMHQEISGTLRVSAERLISRAKGLYRLTSQRLRFRAESDVRIDGERIDLG